MIINDLEYDVLVEANYGYYIEISDKNNENRFILSFAPNHKDLKNLKLNERTLVTNDFHWDPGLVTKKGYYVFDIEDTNIYITRLDDNLFKLELGIKNPYVIVTDINDSQVEYLGVNVEFQFNYDYKPLPDYDILNKGTRIHTHEELMHILDKM